MVPAMGYAELVEINRGQILKSFIKHAKEFEH